MQLRLAVILGLFVAAWASGDDDHDDHNETQGNHTECNEDHAGHAHCDDDHDDDHASTTAQAAAGAPPSAVIAAPICAVAGMVTYSLM